MMDFKLSDKDKADLKETAENIVKGAKRDFMLWSAVLEIIKKQDAK